MAAPNAQLRVGPSGPLADDTVHPPYDGPGTGIFLEERLYAMRLGLGTAVQTIVLPRTVAGVDPYALAADSPPFVYMADMLFGGTHSSGSNQAFTRLVAMWQLNGTDFGDASTDIQDLGTAVTALLLTAGDDGETLPSPQITVVFNENAADLYRYMLDIRIVLMQAE